MFNGPFGGDLSHLVVSALLTALQLRYWTTVVKYDRASSGHVIVFNGFSAKNCWRKRKKKKKKKKKKKRKKGEQRTHKSNNRVRHQKGDRRQFQKKKALKASCAPFDRRSSSAARKILPSPAVASTIFGLIPVLIPTALAISCFFPPPKFCL